MGDDILKAIKTSLLLFIGACFPHLLQVLQVTKNNCLKCTISSKPSYYNEFSYVMITETSRRLMFLKVCGLDSPTNHLILTAFNSQSCLACSIFLSFLCQCPSLNYLTFFNVSFCELCTVFLLMTDDSVDPV